MPASSPRHPHPVAPLFDINAEPGPGQADDPSPASITARLRHLAGSDPRPSPSVQRQQAAALECAHALDAVGAALRHQVGRGRRLELELFDARIARARAARPRGPHAIDRT